MKNFADERRPNYDERAKARTEKLTKRVGRKIPRKKETNGEVTDKEIRSSKIRVTFREE